MADTTIHMVERTVDSVFPKYNWDYINVPPSIWLTNNCNYRVRPFIIPNYHWDYIEVDMTVDMTDTTIRMVHTTVDLMFPKYNWDYMEVPRSIWSIRWSIWSIRWSIWSLRVLVAPRQLGYETVIPIDHRHKAEKFKMGMRKWPRLKLRNTCRSVFCFLDVGISASHL